MAVFRQIISERPDAADWRIESAGTWGLDGEFAAEGSRLVMAERGQDISAHRARTITGEIIREFDLILTMEAGHKEALQLEFQEMRSRVFQLSELIGFRYDIPDPMGKSLDDFRKTANELERIMRSGIGQIDRLILQS